MSNWNFAVASSIGTSHLKTGMPCQDFAACTVIRKDDGTEVLVAVVSDGAGSAQRSQDGALICCERFIQLATNYVKTFSLSLLEKKNVLGWLENIRSEIETVATEDHLKPRDFACTILGLLSCNDTTVYIQIGDGAIVISDGSDLWSCVFWPQKGEFANTTNFITDFAVLDNLEFLVSSDPVAEIAIFSDGIENLVLNHSQKTAFGQWFESMFPAVRTSSTEGENQKLSIALKEYLSSPAVCERTDDDKSLVLATKVREKSMIVRPEKICAQQR